MGSRGKLTVRLPEESLDFIKRYAAEHGTTVTELLTRYMERLQRSASGGEIHPRVAKISGVVPANVDARREYHDHQVDRHR